LEGDEKMSPFGSWGPGRLSRADVTIFPEDEGLKRIYGDRTNEVEKQET
jgi:hypothetical protein